MDDMMTENNENGQKQPEKAISLAEMDAVLRRLEGQEEKHKSKAQERVGSAKKNGAMALGLRISIEFVVTTAVGGIIGYYLDTQLGTLPLLLIIFIFLGFAAGIMNVYRVANGLDDSVGLGRAQKAAQDQSDEKTSKSSENTH
jgi:ATP synthase protein I